MRAEVKRVARNERQLVADHGRVREFRDLAVGIAEGRVELEARRGPGTRLELEPADPRFRHVAEILGRVLREENEEITIARPGRKGVGGKRQTAVEKLSARTDFERVHGLRLEDVADADDAAPRRDRAHAGLIETAAPEPTKRSSAVT